MMTKTEMAEMLAAIRAQIVRGQAQLEAAQGTEAASLRRQLRAYRQSLKLLRAGLAQ